MISACYNKALAYVLRWEGGFTNHPRDPGGPTKYGITIHDVRLYVKRNATINDVRNLSLATAKHIYRTKYWNKVNGDELPAGLDYALFDYGVNSGIGRSNRIIRRLVGLPTNSLAIDKTVIDAINKRNTEKLINALLNEREAFLRCLRTFPTFGRGWMRRTRGVRAEALAMSRSHKQPLLPPPAAKGEVMAKGEVRAPQPGKRTVAGATTVSGGVTVAGWEWITSHPALSVLIVLLSIIVTVMLIYVAKHIAIYLTNRVPSGLEPVPEEPVKLVKKRQRRRIKRGVKS